MPFHCFRGELFLPFDFIKILRDGNVGVFVFFFLRLLGRYEIVYINIENSEGSYLEETFLSVIAIDLAELLFNSCILSSSSCSYFVCPTLNIHIKHLHLLFKYTNKRRS